MFRSSFTAVMPGLVPGIHVLGAASKTWMAGTSPAMTPDMWLDLSETCSEAARECAFR